MLERYGLYVKLCKSQMPIKKIAVLNSDDWMTPFGLLDLASINLQGVRVFLKMRTYNAFGEIRDDLVHLFFHRVENWEYKEKYRSFIGFAEVDCEEGVSLPFKALVILRKESEYDYKNDRK